MSNAFANTLLSAKNIKKSYPMGKGELEVLKGLDLSINAGDAICIMGSSGAGKSTLLHIMGTLDRPSSGKVFFQGQDLSTKSDASLALFRNKNMGFVFQFHHLLNEFNALENVMMPCRIAGMSTKESEERAKAILSELGLGQRLKHFPGELSGGEQQRVAIARALVRSPKILFADEPTGNLDTTNGAKIQELFFNLKDRYGLTLITVTHDSDFASQFPKVLALRDGRWADIFSTPGLLR